MNTACYSLDTHYQCLRISGSDSMNFLQSQLCCDLRRLGPGQVVWTGWCNAKGQVRVLLHVWQQASDEWRLLVCRDAAPQLQRLQMFVLRSVVHIEDIACPLGWFGSAETCVGSPQARISPWRSLIPAGSATPTEHTATSWRCLAALEGEAQLPATMSEKMIPQALGLQLEQGYSLSKGCYPGQEIISRVHYRGRPPKTLRTRVAPEAAAEAFYTDRLPGGLLLSQLLL